MYYHFAVLRLFLPLLKFRILGSDVLPRQVCMEAANSIRSLVQLYSSFYPLRHTPSFLPYFVLNAGVAHLALVATDKTLAQGQARSSSPRDIIMTNHPGNSDPRGTDLLGDSSSTSAEIFARDITYLSEMASCHHFAERAADILRSLAVKWKVHVGMETPPPEPTEVEKTADDVPMTEEEIEEMVMLLQHDPSPPPPPSSSDCMSDDSSVSGTTNMDFFATELPDEETCPLLCPFPLQDRPVLPIGKKALEEAGFSLL
jgi:hypothetical protein